MTFNPMPLRAFESESNEQYIARLHAEADARDPALFINLCYFIGGDEGAIKIGMSIEAKKRLIQIQGSCPIKVRILALASGGEFRERAYHTQFDRHWSHSEWFTRCPEIEAEIERLNHPDTLHQDILAAFMKGQSSNSTSLTRLASTRERIE